MEEEKENLVQVVTGEEDEELIKFMKKTKNPIKSIKTVTKINELGEEVEYVYVQVVRRNSNCYGK